MRSAIALRRGFGNTRLWRSLARPRDNIFTNYKDHLPSHRVMLRSSKLSVIPDILEDPESQNTRVIQVIKDFFSVQRFLPTNHLQSVLVAQEINRTTSHNLYQSCSRTLLSQKILPSVNADVLQEGPDVQSTCLIHKISDTSSTTVLTRP